ncbi:hypothetical protein [Pseudodesulfovibrio pelocollis]|uniref:hypothetical protein n=1 Tax=Pseudodesulfovibrio pelocollis TaxID=3051432 RepID=UPI00255ABE5E|nr:hypothetical protein [Pseudodesulfovibrio sp. SB368]
MSLVPSGCALFDARKCPIDHTGQGFTAICAAVACAGKVLESEIATLKAKLAEANAIKDELGRAVRVMQETINGRFVKGVGDAE